MNKKNIILLAVGLLSFLPLLPVSAVSPTLTNPINYDNFSDLIVLGIIPAVGVIIGSLGTLMIIVSGFLFLTSSGDPNKVKQAKQALVYAILGILIAISAGAITLVVNSILTG